MKISKKTGSVPGDIPVSILQEFLPEFTTPVCAIIKEAVTSHEWPEIYKREYHVPIKKIPAPQDEDDLRGIGLTNWVSKQLERYVLNWIWPYIQPHLDPDQMGGRPGCSIEHYIIKMVHFILSSMDGDHDAAVISFPVDYSKAFNRMQHSEIVMSLEALNVPTCATKLIMSYLTQRSMCVKFNGSTSSFQRSPGGGPQGGLLTGVLFCLQVNKAGSPCPVPQLPARRQQPSQGETTSRPEPPSSRPDPINEPATSVLQPPADTSQEPALGTASIDPQYPSSRQKPAPDTASIDPQPPSSRQEPFFGPANRNEDEIILPSCHKQDLLHKKSYIDDLIMLEKISLANLVKKDKI
jgi:hypothetical protein